ncbi:MAG: hypothetical protein L6R37_001973 [Teloschistes peruensis]|nr:MAG: hypothetical protein L6R37_001973 [Teloschistes peruensis]
MPAVLIFTTLSPGFFTLAGAFFSTHNPPANPPDHNLLYAIAFLNAGFLVLLGVGLYCWICARRPQKSPPAPAVAAAAAAAATNDVELGALGGDDGRRDAGQCQQEQQQQQPPTRPPPRYTPQAAHRTDLPPWSPSPPWSSSFLPPRYTSHTANPPFVPPPPVYMPSRDITFELGGGRASGMPERRCGMCYICQMPSPPAGLTCLSLYERYHHGDGYYPMPYPMPWDGAMP